IQVHSRAVSRLDYGIVIVQKLIVGDPQIGDMAGPAGLYADTPKARHRTAVTVDPAVMVDVAAVNDDVFWRRGAVSDPQSGPRSLADPAVDALAVDGTQHHTGRHRLRRINAGIGLVAVHHAVEEIESGGRIFDHDGRHPVQAGVVGGLDDRSTGRQSADC